MSAKSTQFSPVDAAWLHMEHPTNLMMITGAIMLEGQVDFARARALYGQRLLHFRRFRQRVAEGALGVGLPHWEDDPHFSLDAHIHHIALPAPGSRAQFIDLLSDLSSTPLDFAKPLWQVHVVDNVEGRSAIVMRLHHCIGDGTALGAVTSALFDATPEGFLELPRTAAVRSAAQGVSIAGRLSGFFHGAQTTAGVLWREGMEGVLHPSRIVEVTQAATRMVARTTTRTVSVAGRAIVQPNDPVTPVKGKLGVRKRVAWTEPVPTDETRGIAHALECKINDVLVAAMTGALRRYLLGRSADAVTADIRAIIPVDLRAPDRALDLGNVFGMVFLLMPISLADPLERLRAVKRRMDSLKQSNEAIFYYGLRNIVGMAPKQVEELIVEFFASKATTVFTNVVGPRTPLYIAGSLVDNILFWVPQSGRLSMGISIYSYNNKITMGVITDAGLAPDPERITAYFNDEYRLLQRVANLRLAKSTHGTARPRCIALTRNGSPCRNLAQTGGALCALHARQLSG
jgi:WS/DGAT/MGAT family acyltransferase